MAKKVKTNFSEFTTPDLLERLGEEKERIQKLRFNHVVSQIENPHQIKQIRRDIARIYTELRAREISENK
ncbi:MAG: 50S ribosomal protein L29 [Chitinophagales bacterium]|nr:50S ribosomal protein L29 [Bacteroidota bacterium]MCB9042851.1 50S ribosomal protein L29 [Chitinophagales bacterium]